MRTSSRSGAEDSSPPSARLGIAGVGLLAAFVYGVVVGGSGSGELDPVLRLVNAGISAALIVAYVLMVPRRADHLDRAVLVALLFFTAAGALSSFPRQSFDATLAALAYAAAFFIAREQLNREPMRRAFVAVAMGLSAVFTVGAVAVWGPLIAEWWSAADTLPPLNLQVSAGPWGHRYDVALLISLLYPAWWIGRPSVARRVAALLIGALALAVLLVIGSRTTWVAVIVATATLAIPHLVHLWSTHPRARLPSLALVSLLVVASVILGVVMPIMERVFNLNSLDARLGIWGPMIELWLANPVAGIGPGAFPWALQLTSYFDTWTYAPRHPDNAVFQVLPEAGVLGLAALLLVGGSILWALFRGRSRAALWGPLAFAVACISANPSDFGFLVIVGLAWAAYGAPHEAAPVATERRGPLVVPSLAALAVVFVAHGATIGGAFAYESARANVKGGAPDAAANALETAITLDPGMALYHRQHGTLEFLEGDLARAVTDLERAVHLNPSDDVAWRTLALAREAIGDSVAARDALESAVTVQRADVANLLLAAREAEDRATVLAEVVQRWPTIIAAPGWNEMLPNSTTSAEIVDQAAERWSQEPPSPERFMEEYGVWLGVLADRPDVRDTAIERLGDGPLLRVLATVIGCDPAVSAMLDEVSASERRSRLYWQLRVATSALNGQVHAQAVQALEIMTGRSHSPTLAALRLNPLNETEGWSADRWGYRRWPIEWSGGPTLPSPNAGAALWMFEPRTAVEVAGLEDRLPQC